MYTPDAFSVRDPATVARFVARYDFGLLVAVGADGVPEATHVPFLHEPAPDGPGRLLVHVARANPVAEAARARERALVVFAGPHGYVSPTWYGDPADHVPTWNYVAVHARVRVETMDDPAEVRRLLAATAARHERGPGPVWTVDTPRGDLVADLQRGIVAFRLPVERWEAKAKLSQNRSADDRERVRVALTRRGSPDDLAMLAWWDAAARG